MKRSCLLIIFCSALFSISIPVWAQQAWDTIPRMPEHYKARVELFRKDPIVKEKVIFLGNSIVEGGKWKKLLKDSSVVNRGIGGDITFGILNRINDIIQRKPSKLFLLIGINDISKGIPDNVIIENIFSIVFKVKKGSPKTQIFVQSILPCNSTFKNFPAGYDKNDHVIIINEQLQKYAERIGFTYVDLYAGFTDAGSRMNAVYSVDGLHLNQAGYLHWVEMLKKLNFL